MVAQTRRISPGSGLNVGTAMPCARPVRTAWSEPSPRPRSSTSSLSLLAVVRRVVAAELVVAAADHLLDPLAGLGARDRVEEDAEGDARDQQRRVSAVVSLFALQTVGCVAEVLDRVLQLVADLVVGCDARGQGDCTAPAHQFAVELFRGRERAHHVVAE